MWGWTQNVGQRETLIENHKYYKKHLCRFNELRGDKKGWQQRKSLEPHKTCKSTVNNWNNWSQLWIWWSFDLGTKTQNLENIESRLQKKSDGHRKFKTTWLPKIMKLIRHHSCKNLNQWHQQTWIFSSVIYIYIHIYNVFFINIYVDIYVFFINYKCSYVIYIHTYTYIL